MNKTHDDKLPQRNNRKQNKIKEVGNVAISNGTNNLDEYPKSYHESKSTQSGVRNISNTTEGVNVTINVHGGHLTPVEQSKPVFEADSENTQEMIIALKKLVESTTQRGEYKFTTMRLLLTYCEIKLDKIALLEHIIQSTKRRIRTVDEYLIVHETNNNLMYTHFYVKFNKTIVVSGRNTFNFRNVRPNIERVRQYPIEIDDTLLYLFERDTNPYTNLCKPDYRLFTPIRKRTKAKKVVYGSEYLKALQCEVIETPIDTQILTLSSNSDDPYFEPNSWQTYILDVISGEIDRRAIYWCWDPIGNTGKTRLAKYIQKTNENVLILDGSGTYSELIDSYIVSRKTNEVKILIFDLSRGISKNLLESGDSDIFDFIDQIKNQSTTHNMPLQPNPCHIIIFSNSIFGIENLSSDRWNIIRILEDDDAYIDNVNSKGKIECSRQTICSLYK